MDYHADDHHVLVLPNNSWDKSDKIMFVIHYCKNN